MKIVGEVIELTEDGRLGGRVAAIARANSPSEISLRAKARGDTELPLSNAFSYYKRELESRPSGCVVETRRA